MEGLSKFIMELVEETKTYVKPQRLNISVKSNTPFGVEAQTTFEENGDISIIVHRDHLNDYVLSHELLHVLAKKEIAGLVNVLDSNYIGMIGSELQGYLEHSWILSEQRRRGLEINELEIFSGIESSIGKDLPGLIPNIKRILILNNIVLNFPSVLEAYRPFFLKNNPLSLAYAKRIMAHHKNMAQYSHFGGRRNTVRTINEWKEIFKEEGIDPTPLKNMICVIPVFSKGQLQMSANVVLKFLPNAISQKNEANHIFLTENDDQCCCIFSLDNRQLNELMTCYNTMTLVEFLNVFPMPYLLRK